MLNPIYLIIGLLCDFDKMVNLFAVLGIIGVLTTSAKIAGIFTGSWLLVLSPLLAVAVLTALIGLCVLWGSWVSRSKK